MSQQVKKPDVLVVKCYVPLLVCASEKIIYKIRLLHVTYFN